MIIFVSVLIAIQLFIHLARESINYHRLMNMEVSFWKVINYKTKAEGDQI